MDVQNALESTGKKHGALQSHLGITVLTPVLNIFTNSVQRKTHKINI